MSKTATAAAKIAGFIRVLVAIEALPCDEAPAARERMSLARYVLAPESLGAPEGRANSVRQSLPALLLSWEVLPRDEPPQERPGKGKGFLATLVSIETLPKDPAPEHEPRSSLLRWLMSRERLEEVTGAETGPKSQTDGGK
jgi:hypothetical protein